LPKSIVAHGWLLFEQSKMSKSRGNIVRAETIVDALGADALRYFLLREVVFGQDGSFSFDALVQRYNADLANGYGNLVSRTLSMIRNYFEGRVPEPLESPQILNDATGEPVLGRSRYLRERSAEVVSAAQEHFERLEFSRALEVVWQLISETDGFISSEAPWKLAKDPNARAQLGDVLYTAAEAIRIVTALVYPVMPDAAAKIWAQLGLGDVQQADLKAVAWGGLPPGTQLGEVEPVFPRAEKDTVQRMQETEQKNAEVQAEAQAQAQAQVEARADAQPETAADARAEAALNERPDAPSEADAIVLPSALEAALAAIPLLGAEARAHELATAHPAATATGASVVSRATAAPKPSMASQTAESQQAAVTQAGGATPAASAAPAADAGKITIDDFAKIELRVAVVTVAERVPKADKLLRLEVDLGTETRQILAGIADSYTPESLIGRKVVIVANLQPRKLRGLESNGMIVAASVEGGKAVLAGFLEDVPVGARLK
jgi:methionyl-tRNA synthetase